MSHKALFSRFLGADPKRLHVAAHSHHPWPDATLAAHEQAWADAAERQDDKWDAVFGRVLPEARGHVARVLSLPEADTVAFAPNTHEFVLRILSCLPTPARVLTTDSEFHSFTRQARRLEEDGLLAVERVPAQPHASFDERFAEAAAAGGHDLVFFSHVHFNSGYALADLDAVVAAVPEAETFVVIDGYHGFMALPTDLTRVAARAFYLAGGYKYAMAGEGSVFLHCPPGYGPRPRNTGWYAEFGQMVAPEREGVVAYGADASRFAGATFDHSGVYRFNAVQRMLREHGIAVTDIHAHVRALQDDFLSRLDTLGLGDLRPEALLPPPGAAQRGHFLSFALPDAADVHARLRTAGVITDHREGRLRLGFGLYHDHSDLDVLCDRLRAALGP